MKRLLFSIDLEPNPDGGLSEIGDVMRELENILPTGTIFTTPVIAKEEPSLLRDLSNSFDIGLHLHPEKNHFSKKLQDLNEEQQSQEIKNGKKNIESVIGREIKSFRAGRHSVSKETFKILKEFGFCADASLNPNYSYDLTDLNHNSPFEIEEILELPVTQVKPKLFSKLGLSILPFRSFTTTASTFRANYIFTSGRKAILDSLKIGLDYYSIYFHPYDFMEKFFDRPIRIKEVKEFIKTAIDEGYKLVSVKDGF